jgi:hypothetical protein
MHEFSYGACPSGVQQRPLPKILGAHLNEFMKIYSINTLFISNIRKNPLETRVNAYDAFQPRLMGGGIQYLEMTHRF